MAVVTSSWATLRFRRSKDVKGWALLGIPQVLYPGVMQPLFERQARFIEKHDRGGFVNVLFEAPVTLAARLALAFPAPPSCEPLVVNQAGNRLLYGRFAQSAKARPQAQESDAWPGLKLLQGDESFWQVVTTLSSVATLPLDRLHLPGERIAAQGSDAGAAGDGGDDGSDGRGRGDDLGSGSAASADPSSAAKTALHHLVKRGVKLQSAATLTPRPQLEQSVSSKARAESKNSEAEEGWEEDEWEEDEWEEAGVEAPEEEAFEDIWDTDESADFWADVPLKPALNHVPKPALPSAPQPVQSRAIIPRSKPPGQLTASLSQRQQAPAPLNQNARLSQGRQQNASQWAASASKLAMPKASPKATQGANGANGDRSLTQLSPPANPSGLSKQSQHPRQSQRSEAIAPANPALGRYRSGLVPHASDAGSLQVYNSGGLTVADAIARSRQQEEAAEAIAQQTQQRRVKLPFEQPPAAPQPEDSSTQGSAMPSWSYASDAPQLPEETWAAARAAELAQPSVEPLVEQPLVEQPLVEPSWGEPPWAEPIATHNPWLSPNHYPAQQPTQHPPQYPLSQPALPPQWPASALGLETSESLADGAFETVDWGYYDEAGVWISCDPVMTTPPPIDRSPDGAGSLSPAPTDIVCLPVGEEEHGPILLQGVTVWNDWRRANPHIRPNLRGAYLNNLDLAGADLHGVDLRFAFLFRADLREADLSLALLFGADLIRADLGGASLWGAALGGAYLSYANLAGADLTQADLRGVYWQGTVLAGAIMPNGHYFEEQY